jgi:molybdenum cofactor cytidylyltransferase
VRAAIVLAAGRSSRFGRADKMFAPLRGVPLLVHAVRAARAAPAARVLIATTQPARVRAVLRRHAVPGVHAVPVAEASAPLSTSLRVAIAALRPIERDVFIFLGDMPDVDREAAARLVRRGWRGYAAVRPRHRGLPGHPVFVRNVRGRTLGTGDAGFRIERQAMGWIQGGPGSIRDVDRRGDLRRAAATTRR